MSAVSVLNYASIVAGVISAFCWWKCAAVEVPKTSGKRENIGMGEMNDIQHKLAEALGKQANWSKGGAGAAAIVAVLQVAGAALKS